MIINKHLDELRQNHDKIMNDFIGLQLAQTYHFEEVSVEDFNTLIELAFQTWIKSMINISLEEICHAMGQLKGMELDYKDPTMIDRYIFLSRE